MYILIRSLYIARFSCLYIYIYMYTHTHIYVARGVGACRLQGGRCGGRDRAGVDLDQLLEEALLFHYLHVYLYIYIPIYLCIYTYIYIYIYIHIHIYVFIAVIRLLIYCFVRERACLVTYEQGPTEENQWKKLASGVPSRVRTTPEWKAPSEDS